MQPQQNKEATQWHQRHRGRKSKIKSPNQW
jgi:hypothetical protein